MKLIIAYIQPFVVDRVLSAVHAIPGLSGATLLEGGGFGRGATVERPTAETLFGASPRARIEIAVDDSLEQGVVAAIREAARTGRRGDGKIIVIPILAAYRIATDESGPAVL